MSQLHGAGQPRQSELSPARINQAVMKIVAPLRVHRSAEIRQTPFVRQMLRHEQTMTADLRLDRAAQSVQELPATTRTELSYPTLQLSKPLSELSLRYDRAEKRRLRTRWPVHEVL